MNLIDLPIEVGVLIFKLLDIKSKIHAYNSSNALRDFFPPSLVRKLVLSRSTLATVKTLDQDLFLNLGQHIQELNLSGVADLTVDTLKPHMERFIQLKTLDITFTNIYLSDIAEICSENLKNISIHFFKCPRKCKTQDVWENCQEVFKQKQFLTIHFIVFDHMDSDIPLIFLKDIPSTIVLQITVAHIYKDFWRQDYENETDEYNIMEINFCKLSYVFLDCLFEADEISRFLYGVSNLNFENFEYVFVMYLNKIHIYTSPIFRSIFRESVSDVRIEVCQYLPLDFTLDGNIVFKAWNKASTNFDDHFFTKILEELGNYFPSFVCMHDNFEMTITSATSHWYCIDACNGFEQKLNCLPEKLTLTDFCRKNGTILPTNRPLTLSPEPNTLQNITFLRLSNICVREEFFTVLFTECLKLNTLDIYVDKDNSFITFRDYTLFLSNSIHFAKNLKNMKLTSAYIEYGILFNTLSRCPTLENVHICECERTLGDADVGVDNISLFIEKCENLYSLFIGCEADVTPEALTMFMSPLKQIAERYKREHLCIEVCDSLSWNPFEDIFNPSPLHILD